MCHTHELPSRQALGQGEFQNHVTVLIRHQRWIEEGSLLHVLTQLITLCLRLFCLLLSRSNTLRSFRLHCSSLHLHHRNLHRVFLNQTSCPASRLHEYIPAITHNHRSEETRIGIMVERAERQSTDCLIGRTYSTIGSDYTEGHHRP